MLSEILFRIQELERRMANIISFGTIAAVDLDKARCQVSVGDILTTMIPWLSMRADSSNHVWWAPTIGEQVLVLAPCGEYNQAVVIPAIYQQKTIPKPSNKDAFILQVGLSQIELNSNGQINFQAPQGVFFNTQKVTTPGDFIGATDPTGSLGKKISLVEHLHGGVLIGGAKTNKPVAK